MVRSYSHTQRTTPGRLGGICPTALGGPVPFRGGDKISCGGPPADTLVAARAGKSGHAGTRTMGLRFANPWGVVVVMTGASVQSGSIAPRSAPSADRAAHRRLQAPEPKPRAQCAGPLVRTWDPPTSDDAAWSRRPAKVAFLAHQNPESCWRARRRLYIASSRARTRSRITSCPTFGTHTAVSSPTRCSLARLAPSRRSVLTRSLVFTGSARARRRCSRARNRKRYNPYRKDRPSLISAYGQVAMSGY